MTNIIFPFKNAKSKNIQLKSFSLSFTTAYYGSAKRNNQIDWKIPQIGVEALKCNSFTHASVTTSDLEFAVNKSIRVSSRRDSFGSCLSTILFVR